MSSMCYPDVLQSEIDMYCRLTDRAPIRFHPADAESALREILADSVPARSEALSLRRSIIARLSYCCRRAVA